MSDESGAEVSAAAVRTMRGSVRVTLTCQTSVPDFDSCSSLSGVVNFDVDRCRLDGYIRAGGESNPQSEILDGSTSYTSQTDGRWTFTRGEDGTRGMLHPSGLLDALVHAQTSAVSSSVRTVEVSLNHDELNARASEGLSRDWESIAVAELSPSGRVARVVLTHRSSDDAWIKVECEFSEPCRIATIDLPPPEKTISLAGFIEQQHSQPRG